METINFLFAPHKEFAKNLLAKCGRRIVSVLLWFRCVFPLISHFLLILFWDLMFLWSLMFTCKTHFL